jgi:hypothetical protein
MTSDPYPVKSEPTFHDEAEDRFFVSLFDPTGTMMTARKTRKHLSLAEAKALQADVAEQGGILLIYKEKRPPHRPDCMKPANARLVVAYKYVTTNPPARARLKPIITPRSAVPARS